MGLVFGSCRSFSRSARRSVRGRTRCWLRLAGAEAAHPRVVSCTNDKQQSEKTLGAMTRMVVRNFEVDEKLHHFVIQQKSKQTRTTYTSKSLQVTVMCRRDKARFTRKV